MGRHHHQRSYSTKCSIFQDHHRHFSSENEKIQTGSSLDDDSTTHILQTLQLEPPGSLTPRDIGSAEKAIETLCAEPRPSLQTFNTAKFLLERLIREQDYCNKSAENNQEDVEEDCLYHVRPFLLNRVLDCWRRGWRNGNFNDMTPTDMISWLDQLEAEYGVMADSRALTLVIDGICLRGNPQDAPLVAQFLLDRRMEQVNEMIEAEDHTMEEDEEDQDLIAMRPDTVLISNVIRAWAKSGRMEAPEMAEGLLELMKELYHNGWKESGPNARTYGVTMEAWYGSQRPEAPERILSLLEDMKRSHLEGVDPDRVCYQYAINALVQSKSIQAIDQAHQILQEMIALYESGNDSVAPNASTFSRVMTGYARQGNVEMLEAVLEQLQNLYASTGDRSFQPNDECWKALVIGKSKSGSPVEAQGVLDELVERALSSENSFLMPSRGCFVDTLVGWTKHRDQYVAAKSSHQVLTRMLELGKHPDYAHWLPDGKTFDKVIVAWSRSRHADGPDRIEVLMKEMKNLGIHPNLRTYTNLMLAWQRSGRKDKISQILQVFEGLKDECANRNRRLCPDKFAYGIVIDTLSHGKGNFGEIEMIFEEMMESWQRGNADAKPDTHVFQKLMGATLNLSHGEAIEKCEKLAENMRHIGCPMTALTYGYRILALSQSEEQGHSSKASALLEEALQAGREGTIELPSPKDYRLFLQMIAITGISPRHRQAQQMLEKLPQHGRIHIPKELLPLF
jgi:Pentatricopeptide repeat domain